MQKLEDALAGQADRRAHFVSALALAWPDGHRETVEGTVHGTLAWPPRGAKAYGPLAELFFDTPEQTVDAAGFPKEAL